MTKTPVVIHCMRLHISAGLQSALESGRRRFVKLVKECLNSKIGEIASKSEGQQTKHKLPYSRYFYVGCHQKPQCCGPGLD